MTENASVLRSKSMIRSGIGLIRTALDRLGSVRFAVTIVVLITVACVLGTFLPQGSEVSGFLRAHPDATGWMQFLGWAGLTHVYTSWWFLLLLGLFAASLGRCGTRRLLIMRRTSGPARWRAFGSFLTHLSLLLLFAGGAVRAIWGEKGLMELREGETVGHFQFEGGSKDLPFSIQLKGFSVETYPAEPRVDSHAAESFAAAPQGQLYVEWTERSISVHLPVELHSEKILAPPGQRPTAENSWRIRMDRYEPDFVVDQKTSQVSSQSDQPRNPALLVAVSGPGYSSHQWVFSRFPNRTLHTRGNHEHGTSPLRLMFHAATGIAAGSAAPTGPVKSFKSAIRVVEGEAVIHEETIEVNRPFRYRGYTFFQRGYNPKDLTWTSLQVVRDPGVPVVYAGFTLMVVGLFIVFYLTPWLTRRKETT